MKNAIVHREGAATRRPSGGTALLAAILLTARFAIAPLTAQSETEVIGRSVQGREIMVERIGSGPEDLIIVGGIHGGYEANSVLIARRFAAHFRANPEELGDRFTLHVIDLMNPDGLALVTGGIDAAQFDFRVADTIPGRFNANGVDLNRNFDATWQPVSNWGNRRVSAGSAPFSEPETRAIRDYFLRVEPVASVFYQSAGAFLWYSGAEYRWEPARRLAYVYSQASGYRVREAPPEGRPDDPNRPDITGSADDWFYTIGHRNVTVELTTHYVTEWERNLAGFRALLAALVEE